MLTIRQYRASDLDVCRSLWVELTEQHRRLYDDPTMGGDNPGLFFDKHLFRAGPERIWVAEVDGRVVGMTGLLVEGGEAEVEPVVVSTSARGQGAGSALLARMIAEAKRLGVRYLNIRPVARNKDAIRLFHRAGFQALGRVELFIDLKPQPVETWKPGPELFGLTLKL
jgi:GNAT superfamily N-acetyltransferase